ncbi:MAG: GYD domain-containing protein [Acidobacteria bacterium]|nr:GYD domain-containing protein [Acidobacteriota bacterium]
MPIYITLYNWTDQGIHNVKDAPARIRQTCQSAEAGGGRVLGVFLTMGQYDLVAISEVPDDETYAASLLAQGMMGNVRSTSLRAFSEEEFEGIVGRLP